jgi:flagellar hook-associated protein 2
MSSTGINFSGLASGLDTRAIIDALVAVESRPIKGMEDRQKALRSAKSLFADLDGLLDRLRDKADAVRRSTNFLDYKVALDDDTRLAATIGSNAQAGTWEVNVSALAKAKVSASNGKADANTTTYGAGSLLLTVGTTTREVVINGGNNTLEGIATAINSAGLDVQAQVLDTGAAGSQRYKLVVSSTKTGVDNAFSLVVDQGTNELQGLVTELNTAGSANQVTAASNATFTVNGVSLSRATNTVSDAITGLTLDLKGIHTAATDKTRITVTTDASKTAEKVKGFVDAYNAVVDFIAGQNELDKDGKASNPLFGDTTLRSVRSSLRGILGTSVATGNEEYSLLVQIGVTSDRDGRLTFEQSKLEDAINADEVAVKTLFTDATAGIATRIHAQIEVYTDAVDGAFKARNEGYDRQIRDLDRRIDVAEKRLEAYETQLVNKFAAMETLVSRLQGQGSSLGNLSTRTR